jgi:hypothetical protein
LLSTADSIPKRLRIASGIFFIVSLLYRQPEMTTSSISKDPLPFMSESGFVRAIFLAILYQLNSEHRCSWQISLLYHPHRYVRTDAKETNVSIVPLQYPAFRLSEGDKVRLLRIFSFERFSYMLANCLHPSIRISVSLSAKTALGNRVIATISMFNFILITFVDIQLF